ncbi:MAG: hypothetical protein AAF417_00450 [Pseudomonadota bacterium]
MSDHQFDQADLAEIDGLTDRVKKIVGRRRFMSTAAKAVAFAVPASMVTGVPADALAAGSARPHGGGMMMMGGGMMMMGGGMMMMNNGPF